MRSREPAPGSGETDGETVNRRRLTTRGPVEFLDVRRVRLVEAGGLRMTPEEQQAVDRLWAQAVAGNPHLFDGPLVACTGLHRPRPGVLELRWVRATYRHRALRLVRAPGAWVPSPVFVTVLQPTDEGLVVGRGSATTAGPGRWGLPGGSAEPPGTAGRLLDEAALRRHAARELAEETGVGAEPGCLTLHAVTRGEYGKVGLHFLAPRLPAALVRSRHRGLLAAHAARGDEPELDRLAFVRSAAELHGLGPQADYVPQLVARWAAHQRAGEGQLRNFLGRGGA
ncbi:NUDIX domain-containing protein [Streptomyces albus]|uniref:NUDIX domain-containing protein n=1 Tax=Streptomyces albus TaxID=1888 RepID=UPI001F0B2AA8|nr:NUDIX domain-containing protein [Streptomyces albus]